MGIETLLRTVQISPELGLVPPSTSPLHNSMRCAPPLCAATADSTESAQISKMTESFMFPPRRYPSTGLLLGIEEWRAHCSLWGGHEHCSAFGSPYQCRLHLRQN